MLTDWDLAVYCERILRFLTPPTQKEKLDKKAARLASVAASLEEEAVYAEQEAELRNRIADARTRIAATRPRKKPLPLPRVSKGVIVPILMGLAVVAILVLISVYG